MGQHAWPLALAHLDQMYKLEEDERCCGNNHTVVFVYDKLLRKSVANWAELNDRSLGVQFVFAERDKQILEASRTRLLPTSAGRNPSGSVSTPVSATDKAKEAAEAERIVSRANQAANELAKQQTQLEASMKAMSTAKGIVRSREKNKGKTNKQVKAEKFFDKQRTQRANKNWAHGASTNPKLVWTPKLVDWEVTRAVREVPGLNAILEATGDMCLELFCGLATLTLALTFEKVPCVCPWSSALGSEFDVVADGEVLVQLAKENRLSFFVHFKLPCQTMTWARLPPARWGKGGLDELLLSCCLRRSA